MTVVGEEAGENRNSPVMLSSRQQFYNILQTLKKIIRIHMISIPCKTFSRIYFRFQQFKLKVFAVQN